MEERAVLAGFTVLFATLMLSVAVLAGPADQPGHQSPAPGTNSTAGDTVRDTTAHVVGTVSAEATIGTQGFVDGAATSDMYEVEAGQIALQRSQNADVKAFAQKMIDAHTATTASLKAILASASGVNPPPAHVDDRRQGLLDDLRGAPTANFDSTYISQQVDAHNEAVILFRGYAHDGDNRDIRKFAASTLPKIEQHLAMAKKLNTQLARK